MDVRHLGAGPLGDVELLVGGTQNVLLRFTRAERGYVLRRPPLHKRANSDETMRREARVLAALAGSAVPHPGLIAAEPDVDVLGAAFYLMDAIGGVNPTLGLPEPLASSPDRQRRMGLAMPDALAALAAIDVAHTGIGDLGRADGWLERQVPRWRSQLESYGQLEGYPGPEIGDVAEVAAWLDAHRPQRMRATLIHGDFHFANVLVDPATGELAAVVDWELATIGHPLLDLGHLLATWPAAESGVAELDTAYLPSVDEVIDRYAVASGGADLADLTWFRVLACYRLGIILEGTNARAAAGLAQVEVGDRLHEITVRLFHLASELIAS